MSRAADCTISIYWSDRYKRWAITAARNGTPSVRTVTADTTVEIDDVAVWKLVHAVQNEMELWLF